MNQLLVPPMPQLNIEQAEAFIPYLQSKGWIDADERPACTVLRGGVSNRTVLVERDDGRHWVFKQALNKLRVQDDWFSDPERVHREAEGIRWLQRLLPPGSVAPLRYEDRSLHIIGMDAVRQPHVNWKTELLAGRIETSYVRQFGELLALIHRNSRWHLPAIQQTLSDRSFFKALRLEPYYLASAERIPEARSFLASLIEETVGYKEALVHGDYSPKNILVHDGRFVLLDHEVIHVGDPAFDLGFALTHLLSKAHHVANKRDAFADAVRVFWAYYARRLRDWDYAQALEARAVRHTLACLLARAAGRSKLEYLTEQERDAQIAAAVKLMQDHPIDLDLLVDQFIESL